MRREGSQVSMSVARGSALTFSSPVATAEFSKFAGIWSASPDISLSLPSPTPECLESTPSGSYLRSPRLEQGAGQVSVGHPFSAVRTPQFCSVSSQLLLTGYSWVRERPRAEHSLSVLLGL